MMHKCQVRIFDGLKFPRILPKKRKDFSIETVVNQTVPILTEYAPRRFNTLSLYSGRRGKPLFTFGGRVYFTEPERNPNPITRRSAMKRWFFVLTLLITLSLGLLSISGCGGSSSSGSGTVVTGSGK